MKTSMHSGTRDSGTTPALEPGGMVNLSRLSVLVADGDAAQSRRTLDLLSKLEVRDVVCAADADSALRWLRARAFDVLLCSSKLGAADGLELIRQARQLSPATRSVLIRPHSRTPQPEGIEALDRPFSAASLQALLSRSAAPLGGLWCEVPQLSLADILQMYHQGRRSITVLLSGPIAGRIRLVDGEIVHAESGNLEGPAALSRLLEADSGLLRTETSTLDGPRTIYGPFESVVLSAVQLLDEQRRDRAGSAAPPPTQSAELLGLDSALPPQLPDVRAGASSSQRRTLVYALATGLIVIAVMLVFLVRSIAARGAAASRAGARVQSDVRGLEAQPAPPPPMQPAQPPAASTALAPAPVAAAAPEQAQPSRAESETEVLDAAKLRPAPRKRVERRSRRSRRPRLDIRSRR